jgi:hypothetical protein
MIEANPAAGTREIPPLHVFRGSRELPPCPQLRPSLVFALLSGGTLPWGHGGEKVPHVSGALPR